MKKFPRIPDYIAAEARNSLLRDKGEMAHWLVKDNVDELRLYLGTLETFIEHEEKREIADLEKHASADDEQFWADYYPYQWQQIIGSQLRKSFVVSLMSLAEFHLGLFCRDVATLTEAKITLKDLKGPLFTRARKFLETFAGFVSPTQAAWEIIGDLYVLRNSIVHNAALVDVDRNLDRIEAFMRRAPGISVPSAGVLEMQKEFCVFALSGVEDFIAALHREYVGLCARLEGSQGFFFPSPHTTPQAGPHRAVHQGRQAVTGL